MRFKILLEFSGTKYSGWQVQDNSRTVQGTLIKTIKEVFQESKGNSKFIDLQGSGRTDAGVHAIEQTAHLVCETMLAPEILKMKINDKLPSDINILEITKTHKDFHARHSAISRQYLYVISKRRTALEKKYVWWVKDELDVKKMQDAAKLFIGKHDFKSFSEKNNEHKSTKCLVESIEITESKDKIFIRIRSSHFLWKMVRRIVGVLAEAGRGNITKTEIEKYLKYFSTEPAKFTAPPSGLFLEKVYY